MPGADPGAPAPWRLVAAYAAVYLVWGSTYLAIRYAVETIPPFAMAGSRFVIAGGLLYAVLRARGIPAPTYRQWAAAAGIGTLLIGVGNGAVSWAEQHIPSGIAALLVATVPLWVALLEGLRARRLPPWGVWAGIALGVAGVAVLVGAPQEWELGPLAVLGAIAVLVASWAWAVGSVASRVVPRPTSALLAASMHMLTGGAVLLAASVTVGEGWDLGEVTAASALAWGYLVVFGSWVGFTAYVWLLQVDAPTRVATYAYVNPLIAVGLGWALAAEPVTPRIAASAVLVVGAVALILRLRKAPAPPPPPSRQ